MGWGSQGESECCPQAAALLPHQLTLLLSLVSLHPGHGFPTGNHNTEALAFS